MSQPRKGRRGPHSQPRGHHAQPPAYLSNLQSALLHTAPVVPQYGDADALPSPAAGHFALADVWQSYEAWSAYGCEVPMRIQVDGAWQEVIQCYTPYLSGIQLFGADHTLRISSGAASSCSEAAGEGAAPDTAPCATCGGMGGAGGAPAEEAGSPSADCSDDECCSTAGGGSSAASVAGSCASSACTCSTASTASTASDSEDGEGEGEGEECCKRRGGSPTAAARRLARAAVRGSVLGPVQPLGEPTEPLFEYSEAERPHLRQPLHDQIMELAEAFPGLLTLDSRDLHPTSWFAVTWVPIYRVPSVPDPLASRDLAANFLTFHSLSVPPQRLAAAPSDLCSIAPLPPLLDPAGAAAVAWRTELARQQLLSNALSALAAQQAAAQQAAAQQPASEPASPAAGAAADAPAAAAGAAQQRLPALPLAAACLRPFAFMPYKVQGRTWVDDWNLQRQHLPMIAAAGSWVERRRVQLPDFDFFSQTYRPLPTGYHGGERHGHSGHRR